MSFDPSEPRDDHGKWTSGGGGASNASGHNAGVGNREIVNRVATQHAAAGPSSYLGGIVSGATRGIGFGGVVGGVVGGAAGALSALAFNSAVPLSVFAVNPVSGAIAGATEGAILGAKIGGAFGAIHGVAERSIAIKTQLAVQHAMSTGRSS